MRQTRAMIVTRFAPSPNGSLHLGHAFSAITAHDLARDLQRGAGAGRFVLRIEDIDGVRSRPELAQQFRHDLAWLGLAWREVAPQSVRLASYSAAAARLRAEGLLYPCVCTRAQIAAAATREGPDGPVYPGTCKGLALDGRAPAALRLDGRGGAALRLDGRGGTAWRLDVARAMRQTGPLTWFDQLAGEQQARPDLAGDVVLVRKDAATPASYHLAATLDDAADGITLVTRGADLFAASHIHRLLQALLGLPVPRWHHHALLVDDKAQKLAKRRGSPALADLRAAGDDGLALADRLRSRELPAGIHLAPPLYCGA